MLKFPHTVILMVQENYFQICIFLDTLNKIVSFVMDNWNVHFADFSIRYLVLIILSARMGVSWMFRTSCEVSAMPTLTAARQARANYFLHLATTILITVTHTWLGRVLRDTEQLHAIIIPTLVTACARAIIFLLEIIAVPVIIAVAAFVAIITVIADATLHGRASE